MRRQRHPSLARSASDGTGASLALRARKARIDGFDIQRILEEGLAAHLGRPVRLAALAVRPLDAQSTYPIERLRVTLASGEHVSVIFKRLGAAQESKGHRREVLIYRRLLAGQRFGAPALYASIYDEAQHCYWLFLEDLGRKTLARSNRDGWLAAVSWLAEMHAAYHGREEDLRALDCLAEHGLDYYQRLARNARRHLRQVGDRDRKSTRLNSSHIQKSRMPSSA